MKQSLFNVVVLAIFAMLFTSCGNEGELLKDEVHEPMTKASCITPEQAKQTVLSFLEAFEKASSPNARGENYKRREILDVKAVSKEAFAEISRSSQLPDTLFYIINFADSAGYAVAGAQPGMEPLYALVDNGNADASTLGLGDSGSDPNEFLYWKDAIFEWENGGKPQYPAPDTVIGKWAIYSIITPQIDTKWGQGRNQDTSYGKYFKNRLTGCTIIAAAQLLYHYSLPQTIDWTDENGRDMLINMYWETIKMNNKAFGGSLDTGATPSHLDKVAKLCRTIGLDVKADDSAEDKTTANSDKVLNWLRTKAGLNAPKLGDYSEDKIIQAAKDSKPVYIRAENKAGTGHAWVIDGYISGYCNGYKTMFYCNWGFHGDKNGYYVSKVFNANNQPELTEEDVKARGADKDLNFYRNYKISIMPPKND